LTESMIQTFVNGPDAKMTLALTSVDAESSHTRDGGEKDISTNHGTMHYIAGTVHAGYQLEHASHPFLCEADPWSEHPDFYVPNIGVYSCDLLHHAGQMVLAGRRGPLGPFPTACGSDLMYCPANNIDGRPIFVKPGYMASGDVFAEASQGHTPAYYPRADDTRVEYVPHPTGHRYSSQTNCAPTATNGFAGKYCDSGAVHDCPPGGQLNLITTPPGVCGEFQAPAATVAPVATGIAPVDFVVAQIDENPGGAGGAIAVLVILFVLSLLAIGILYYKYSKMHSKMYSKKTQSALKRFTQSRGGTRRFRDEAGSKTRFADEDSAVVDLDSDSQKSEKKNPNVDLEVGDGPK